MQTSCPEPPCTLCLILTHHRSCLLLPPHTGAGLDHMDFGHDDNGPVLSLPADHHTNMESTSGPPPHAAASGSSAPSMGSRHQLPQQQQQQHMQQMHQSSSVPAGSTPGLLGTPGIGDGAAPGFVSPHQQHASLLNPSPGVGLHSMGGDMDAAGGGGVGGTGAERAGGGGGRGWGGGGWGRRGQERGDA